MALTAFLPWEKWLARLLHALYVAMQRRWFRFRQDRSLVRSASWPEIKGEVSRIVWDSSLPREQILYSYLTDQGYYSGDAWRWFDSVNAHEVRAGDRVVLRCDPHDSQQSVFLRVEGATTTRNETNPFGSSQVKGL